MQTLVFRSNPVEKKKREERENLKEEEWTSGRPTRDQSSLQSKLTIGIRGVWLEAQFVFNIHETHVEKGGRPEDVTALFIVTCYSSAPPPRSPEEEKAERGERTSCDKLHILSIHRAVTTFPHSSLSEAVMRYVTPVSGLWMTSKELRHTTWAAARHGWWVTVGTQHDVVRFISLPLFIFYLWTCRLVWSAPLRWERLWHKHLHWSYCDLLMFLMPFLLRCYFCCHFDKCWCLFHCLK